jgi:filamentous hemagglutinin
VGNDPVNFNDPDGLLAKSAGNWLDTQTHGYFSDFVDVGRDTLSLPGVQTTLYGGAAMAAGGGVGSSLLSNPVTRAVAGAAATVLDLQNAADGVPPIVTARATVGSSVFTDVNQTARLGANAARPTLIADRVATKMDLTGKVLPNGNMATAHAEIGAMQQAFDAGVTSGVNMVLTVTGKPVCGFCRGDIAAMADKAGLNSLTVIEEATGNTLSWGPGMKSLKAQ